MLDVKGEFITRPAYPSRVGNMMSKNSSSGSDCYGLMGQQYLEIIDRLYSDVWNGERPETADERVSEDYYIHDREVAEQLRGPALYKQLASMTRDIFPDMEIMIEDIFAANDKVAVRWTMTGTHQGELDGLPPTGTEVELAAIEINRFEKGKLAETWTQSDQLGLMNQLGALSDGK